MQTALLIIALSMDVFLASVACGTEKIKIGNRTALCISAICSGVLFLSLMMGNLFQRVIQPQYAQILCFTGFFLIGAVKLAEYGIKAYIRKHKFLCKRIKISFSQLNFILSIYNNPVMADIDHSADMSVAEGVCFAVAMSVDGLFAGIGAAFLDIDMGITTLLNFLISVLAVRGGSTLGRYVSMKKGMDLSWIGGVIFILLAFGKIL